MGRAVVMTAGQARQAIGEAVTARITRLFEACLAGMREDGLVEVYAKSWRRSALPGHDPSAVPPVPTALVVTGKAWSEPGVIFTWKSESGDPPYFQMDTPAGWMTQVVHAGHAVIDGLPVTAVLERDDQRRPSKVLTVALTGYFDVSIHGWRAWARDSVREVDWADPDQPTFRPAVAG
ncbi:hypothetical protein ACFXPX_32755 [Kitasatospora sp. NPDC059146]|uniref:hypothetical protein n=1 Tax=unclassified Kitasatospora TaxID=2633591 RepID=UPI003696FAC1